MPYDVENPPKDLVQRIKARHPDAKKKDVRQFIHVFNGEYASSGDEGKAFRRAWGVLKARLGSARTSSRLLKLVDKLAKRDPSLSDRLASALVRSIEH